jgi:hypothetical protein
MATCTVTLDTRAFDSEVGRAQQRGQRVIRGTIAGDSTYANPNGDLADLTDYFPRSGFDQTVKYRVILNPISNTGNRVGVYNHTTKKLLIYTALGTEAVNGTDQSVNGIFSFVAIGE